MSVALRLAALGLALLLGLARSDWVEIPQFSDQHKVYRQPARVAGPGDAEADRHRPHEVERVADRFSQKISFPKEIGLRNVSELSAKRRRPITSNEPTFVGTIATYTTERAIGSTVGGETYQSEIDEGIRVDTFEEDDEITQFDQPLIQDDVEEDIKTTTTEPLETSTGAGTSETTTNEQPEEEEKGFFNYLPIDLLKRVHKTLQSQPPNLQGKIRFLKSFERTLVKEIGSRLSSALSPTRLPRDARGHDYHDDHDDGIGFPSLEGTLMAISFLAFAIFLVRLVMMLFRNTTNGNSVPILIGRKRRSVDNFADEAARILGYLQDSAVQHRY